MKKTISAVLVVKNEEKHIEECLKRIVWVDEIIILDNGSTDKTLMKARKYTQKIIIDTSPFNDFLYNKAIKKAYGEWIFLIDADERVTDGLREEIINIVSKPNQKMKGYYIPFKHFFLGKWLRYGGWYPSYLLRLIKREHAIVSSPIHEMFTLKKGEAWYLHNHILHYGDLSLEQRVNKINIYSTLEAKELVTKRRAVNIFTLLFLGVFRCFKSYILRFGFLDGVPGLIRAILLFYTTFLAYAKYYEKNNIFIKKQ